MLVGNTNRIEKSDIKQYFHPACLPQKGNYIIDGGVGCSISTIKDFEQYVEAEGKIFSFEALKENFDRDVVQLKEAGFQNVEIYNMGLWDKKDTVNLYHNDVPDGSSLINKCEFGHEECSLISIDEFINDNHIPKVDFIKLDIEGAESKCLYGAINTIKKFKPVLAVSAYHKDEDLFSLILQINSLGLGYEFYLVHHTVFLYETVLYAVCKNQ